MKSHTYLLDARTNSIPVGQNMTPEALKRFTDLKSNNELLDPSVPGTIYANLSQRGFSKEINGKYLRYNDPLLESYIK